MRARRQLEVTPGGQACGRANQRTGSLGAARRSGGSAGLAVSEPRWVSARAPDFPVPSLGCSAGSSSPAVLRSIPTPGVRHPPSAAECPPPAPVLALRWREARPGDARPRLRLAQKWIKSDFPLFPGCQRPSHLKSPGLQPPKAQLGAVTCYFLRSHSLPTAGVSARLRAQGRAWGPRERGAAEAGGRHSAGSETYRRPPSLSVPESSDAIAPARARSRGAAHQSSSSAARALGANVFPW